MSSLSGLLEKDPNEKSAPGSGANTVAGDQNVQSIEGGEIITRPDGKKVRRVRRASVLGVGGGEGGEVYRRSELVRRVPVPAGSSGAGGASSTPNSPAPSPFSPAGGSTGEQSSSEPGGDTYRRADGKLVRRFKASDLGSFMNNQTKVA
eukprot:CAMPEP_0198154072 /NCGR_PEP_ID=MMETSP1443-20131203/67148_1 /TAXON_ID=186043 /ORGANISM="Entomoneis sp., Strain CCMP2396" /LENGTH=148 /DNA_ID=CAMNT_0043820651 /DNA_START=241 /DNA_END=683 /DNA_ORIENTATION=+